MLNEKNERELAYVVKIDAIEPITGSDNCEAAVVGGWRIMVRKQTFQPGDLAVYFEIDSHVDTSKPEFAFLEKKHGNIKTQKYTFGGKGNFVSQGLLMAPADFGWEIHEDMGVEPEGVAYMGEGNGEKMIFVPATQAWGREHTFLTEYLGVTYAVAEDNSRKAKPEDKYKRMAQRNGKLFSHQPFRFMMRYTWGRKLLFVFFGNKKDTKTAWPQWVVKTDEERIENIPFMLANKSPFIATEKIDGTSTTFTMKRGKKKLFGKTKNDFYVCSRNVVFDKPNKACFYDTNVYLEMAEKYHIEDVLTDILNKMPDLEWVTIQGETYGETIQKRDYGLKEHRLAAFNFITSAEGRWNSVRAAKFLSEYNVPWVPILDENYILPDTIDELRAFSHSETSRIDGVIKEGIVFRSQDGTTSFKCVDPEFLLKYHS